MADGLEILYEKYNILSEAKEKVAEVSQVNKKNHMLITLVYFFSTVKSLSIAFEISMAVKKKRNLRHK